jgi:hypothetical protein
MSQISTYWELGRIDSFPGGINTKPEKLEIDLIEFVKSHPETFSREEMKNIKRGIIRAFAMRACPFQSRGDSPSYKPGFSVIAQLILTTISDKITHRQINISQEVKDALAYFQVCVEFIDTFLPSLCSTESNHTHMGNGGFVGSNRWKCELIAESVKFSSEFYPNIFRRVNSTINKYQAHVLTLWAGVLIRENKITSPEIAQMEAVVHTKDGYERKMRELLTECGGGYAFTSNLNESILLKWLTLFHVAAAKNISLTELYSNGGKASTLDGIVYGIISQFVTINNVYGYPIIPESKQHASELNMLHLTCNIIAKMPNIDPQQRTPVYAYLSSDILDQCVKNVGRFPTTDQFILFLNTRMVEKAAAFNPPHHPAVPRQLDAVEGRPPASAPPLEFDSGGGNKTKRKVNKMQKKLKKSRRRCRERMLR